MLAVAFALYSGIICSILISFSDSFANRILDAFFRASRKKIKNKYRYTFLERSTCENCNAQIKSIYLIPIIGYLLSKGRCYSCNTKINKRFFYEESIAFIYGMLLGYLHPQIDFLFFSMIYFVLAFIAGRIDYEKLLIPTEIIFALLAITVGERIYFDYYKTGSIEFDKFAGLNVNLLIPMIWYLVFHLIRIVSRYQLGLADVRITFAFNLALGYPLSLYLPTVASSLGIIFYFLVKKGALTYSTYHTKDGKLRIPFGVFLSLSFLLLRIFQVL